MKKIIALFISFLFFSHHAWACEPCSRGVTPLKDIVTQADLIVIGERHDSPWFFDDNYGSNPPSNIEVKVDRVLKGKLSTQVISVNSWAGMCAYGVTLFKERSLLLLKEVAENRYSTVDAVCGVNQYTIIDNHLTRKDYGGANINNEPLMSINEFIEKYL